MLSKLIGMQIVDIDETKIIVKNPANNELYKIAIEDDSGCCCGYNEIVTNLFVEKNSNRNPIITNVEMISEEYDESDEAIVAFYGENKQIAEISALSSSGSGWGYGANVRLVCKKLDIELMLTHF